MLIVCARQEGQRAHTIRMDQHVHSARNTADAEEHQARHQGDSAPDELLQPVGHGEVLQDAGGYVALRIS